MKEYLSNVLEILEEKGVLNESYDLEFKSAKGGLPRSLWESYSAFANSEGGTIILGVSEKDNYCYLDGLGEDVVRKWLDDFWNQINNKEKVSVNLLTAKDVRIEKVKDDINVLIIRVPPASFRYRPVYIGTDMLKGTYRRDHTGDYRCMPEEVKRMLADSLPDKPDSLVLEHSTIEDLDLPTLDQYRNILRSVKPMHPFLTLDNLPFFAEVGSLESKSSDRNLWFNCRRIIDVRKNTINTRIFPGLSCRLPRDIQSRESLDRPYISRWYMGG